jgi:hypothetical protein
MVAGEGGERRVLDNGCCSRDRQEARDLLDAVPVMTSL